MSKSTTTDSTHKIKTRVHALKKINSREHLQAREIKKKLRKHNNSKSLKIINEILQKGGSSGFQKKSHN